VAANRRDAILAAGYNDGQIVLWRVSNPTHPQMLGHPLIAAASTGQQTAVQALAFSPNGRLLASGDLDGSIEIWNITNKSHPRPLGTLMARFGTWSVAFSPDNATLAVGDGSANVHLLHVTPAEKPRAVAEVPVAGTGYVYAVAFSADGHLLAAGGDGGLVQLWNVVDATQPESLGEPLAVGARIVNALAFSPESRTLAAGVNDSGIRLWDLSVTHIAHRICSATENVMTYQQWHTYAPELPYRPPCGQ
jgi:WD40 repeat protein